MNYLCFYLAKLILLKLKINKTFKFSIQKFGLFYKNKLQNDAKDTIKDRFIK